MNLVRAGAIQMVSGRDVEANLSMAEKLITQGAENGAQILALPENFAVLDSHNLLPWAKQEEATQVFTRFLAQQSRHHKVWLIAGTIPMLSPHSGEVNDDENQRVRAASLVFNSQGEVVSRYDKIHLFDVLVNDKQGQYKESKTIEPGQDLVMQETPFGNLGQTVCYDLRFPELYSALRQQGAEIFSVPSAFTEKTGEAHWQSLLQARAIENQCFVIAPNQGGQHTPNRKTWGHSMVLDPWGNILSQLDKGEGVAMAEMDMDWLQEIRDAMPVQQHKKFQVVPLS